MSSSISSAATSQLTNYAGIDTQTLISQLIFSDQQAFLGPLQTKQSNIQNQLSQYNQLKTKVTPLQSAAQKLTDSLIFTSSDLFKARTVTSSDTDYVTATATNSAASNTLTMSVANLASATKATSTAKIGQVINSATLMSGFTNGTVSTGTFSVFVNGVRNDINVNGKSGISTSTALSSFPNGSVTSGDFTVTVDGTPHTISVNRSTDKVSDVLSRITAVLPGGTSAVDSDGKITLSYTTGSTVSLTAGTSNFLDLTGLVNTTTTTGVSTDSITSHADTVDDVLDRVTAVLPGGSYSIDSDGKISFTYTHGTNVTLGSGTDSSNFINLAGLVNPTTTSGVTDTLTGQNGVSTVDTSKTLTDNAANLSTTVTAGTFTIAGKSYTVDSSTTLSSILSKINTDGKVVATFNNLTNKIELTSKTTGANAILLGSSSDTSNFLSATNLVNSGDSLTSQTLGQNATFTVNGVTYKSASNTSVGSSVHGLTGLTLNLLQPTDTAKTLTVSQDQDTLKKAVQTFLDTMNTLVSHIRTQTAVTTSTTDNTTSRGPLASDQSVLSLSTQIRSIMSTSVTGLSTYTNMAQIGITTGAAGQSVSNASSSSFSIDAAKFAAALADNPDEVKTMLIGNGTGTARGLIQRIKDVMDGATNPTFGMFTARTKSANAQLKSINDSITRVNERLDKKQRSLQQQFTVMNQTVQQLRQQQSSFR